VVTGVLMGTSIESAPMRIEVEETSSIPPVNLDLDQINHFRFGSKAVPHPDKVGKGGEDAFYAQAQMLAVADGVGGWAKHGVDPGLYSKELCTHIRKLNELNRATYKEDPKSLLVLAARQTKSEGSSTLVILSIDESKPILRTSYVGDSCYMIFRQKEDQTTLQLVHASQEQVKRFNFPYQIGSVGDSPLTALEYTHEVEDGDIIVVGSDGLFDNMNANQIADNLMSQKGNSTWDDLDLNSAAHSIADLAHEYSLDSDYDSPFAKGARAAGFTYSGGKSDDITVVIGQVRIRPREGTQVPNTMNGGMMEQ